MMLATQPNNIERLRVIGVMRLTFGVLADYAGLPLQLPSINALIH